MSVNKQLSWLGTAPQFLPTLGGVKSLKYLQLPGMTLQHSERACMRVCVCCSNKRGRGRGPCFCEGMIRQRPRRAQRQMSGVVTGEDDRLPSGESRAAEPINGANL